MFPAFAVTVVGSLLCCGVHGYFSVLFSVCCITSFGACARPQHQETTTAEAREDSEQESPKGDF